MKRWSWMVPALALLSLAGCAGMSWGEVLEDVLADAGGVGAYGNRVRGEVEWVDPGQRALSIRTGYRGATRLRYDSRTQVVYRGERYPVGSLARGDQVSAEVERDNRGEAYATQIYVEETRDGDDRDGEGRVERFDGRVGWIEHDRGRFQLRASRGSYTVTLPYNASSSTRDRFRRLRSGDDVRIEGELMGNGWVELVRFR